MLFMQSIHSSVLDLLMNAVSFFGEMFLPLVAITVLYWCIDKKKAFIITSVMTTALITTQIIKSIVRSPRPFQVYPELIEGDRISTATGYSFPSGHSTLGSAFYSACARAFTNPLITAASILLIILIPVSRLYLGVHWPIDVLAGTLIGLAASFLLTPLFSEAARDKKGFERFSLIYGFIMLAIALYALAMLERGGDRSAFSDMMSTATVTAAAMIGFSLESRLARFSVENTPLKKVLVTLLGLILLVLSALAIRKIPLSHDISSFLLYAFSGLWITFIYPYIGIRTGLFSQSE